MGRAVGEYPVSFKRIRVLCVGRPTVGAREYGYRAVGTEPPLPAPNAC
jgi:hypothetical protein